jgi:hypothetical protein
MAQLNKSVLGTVSGALGDIIFRQRNGKNIIVMRPSRYIPPSDQGSIDRRNRFALSAKLAQSIYSVPELALLWQPLTPPGMSTFNFIIQKNILLINPTSVSSLTTITPDSKFVVNCTSSSVTADTITVELAALGNATGIDASKERNAKLAYILCLANPTNTSLPSERFVAGTSVPKQLVLDTPLSFSIALTGQDAMSVENYGDKKLLFVLITLDSENAPVNHSGTVMK